MAARDGADKRRGDGIDAAQNAFDLQSEAHGLADHLPDLLLEAARITNTVAHGIHGRKRAGPGETFWQFRHFETNDTAQQIDWRRSASSDQLFVREREWEAAHTVWLWPDLSASMVFRSHLSSTLKRDRAVVLMLAIGELLVKGGERIALLGLTKPSAGRTTTTRLAETLATHADHPTLTESLPPSTRLSRFSGTILFSDFLDPLDEIEARLRDLASDGVSGHLVQVLDPAEETLPYEGRAEFIAAEGGLRWVADRTESIRDAYQRKFTAHRAGLSELAKRFGWSFLVHHTDRPATEPLLTLIMRLQGQQGDYRWQGASSVSETSTGKSGPGGPRSRRPDAQQETP
ncbi:MAG: DUF58 domain-containing protein [Pseudomonadota bacterium]